MGEELRPCPFCGAHKQPEGIGLRWEEEPDDLFYVACERCGGRTMGGDTEAEAITAWQTRAAPDHIAAIREAVEVCAKLCERLASEGDAYERDCAGERSWFNLKGDGQRAAAAAIRAHLDTLLQTKGDDRGEG